MKKIISAMLALAMVCSLASCGKKDEPSGTSSGSSTSSANHSSAETLNYPKNTINIIVPYSAGGAMDTTARVFAKYAEKICGQSVIITNVAGGSGSVGAQQVLNSKADGYTVLISDPGPGFVTTSVNSVPFDFEKDFVVAGRQTFDARLIAVRADDARFSTPEDFIQYVKDHPGELNVGSPGATSDGAISVTLLKQAGLEMNAVACNGSSEVKSQLLGGHIDVGALSVSDVIPMLADNQVMVVAVCSDETNEMLPDAKTFKELGYDVSWGTSRGYSFKAGTDEKIVQYWSDLIAQVSADPDYQQDLANIGCPVATMDKDEYATYVGETFQTIRDVLG